MKKVFLFAVIFSVVFSGWPAQLLLNVSKDNKIVDKLYLATRAKNVVDRFNIKEAKASTDSSELEYMINIGPVTGSTAAGYVYGTIFNPASNTRTTIIKKLRLSSNAVAGAVYQTISVRRITAASAGTQVLAPNIPKKNTSSVNANTEIRHTNVTVTYGQATTSRITSIIAAGTTGVVYSRKEIDLSNTEDIVLTPGQGVAIYQETAGDTDQRVRVLAEWEEVANAPSAQDEFLFAFPRVAVAATAGYVFNSFFNPVGSGKTAIIESLNIHAFCDGAALYTNNIGVRRITAASGGTQIPANEVPAKSSSSSASILDIRHTGVTVTWSQATTSLLSMITPCAVAGQPGGDLSLDIQPNDEKIIIQPGEGIALFTDAAGDANQLVFMDLEWDEDASTPSSAGEYLFVYPRVERAAAANEKYDTFFNPSGSGKTAVIKRLGILVNNDAAATANQALSIRRISAASGGTQMAAADVPKKHTGTGNTAMELRYNNVTATLSGSATDARLLGVTAPNNVGQLMGANQIIFGSNEKLVLKPGEGITLYSEAAGDVDNYVKLLIEWDEEASAPSTQNEYLTAIGQVSGANTADYVYASFFNPASSSKASMIKRIQIRVDAVAAAATTIPISLWRITAASGGTQVLNANIPVKNSSTTQSTMELRKGGVTITPEGTTERLISVPSPTAVETLSGGGQGRVEMVFTNQEDIVLQANEGIALKQEGTQTGMTGMRVFLTVEWDEETSATASQGEYLYSTGSLNGVTTVNYGFSTLFNPSNSNKNFVVTRLETRVTASTTATYINASVVRISTSTGGTLVSASNIAKKHNGTSVSVAEVRNLGMTYATTSPQTSRLLNVTTPGAANQWHGIAEAVVVYGDELVLRPGEGLMFYQETAGDTDHKHYVRMQWKEVAIVSNITISGTIYDTNESSVLTSQPIVAMAVASTSLATTTAAANGTFSFSTTTPTTGAVITLWLNTNGGEHATLVFDYGAGCVGGNCTALSLYKNRVMFETRNSSTTTNATLANCDNDTGSACSDTDIGFTSNSGTLTLTWPTNILRIASSTSVFAPGGAVNAQHFSQSNGSFLGGSSALTFSGDFNVSGGIATSTSGVLKVRGDWSNSATFKHNNGIVEIDPINDQSVIVGMTATSTKSFYDLRMIKPGGALYFTSGQNVYVEHDFRLEGVEGNPGRIRATTPDSKWFIYIGNNALVNFASVRDSGCVVGTHEVFLTPSVLNFGGNGPCWHFIYASGGGGSSGGPLLPPDDPNGGSGGGTPQGGGGFKPPLPPPPPDGGSGGGAPVGGGGAGGGGGGAAP